MVVLEGVRFLMSEVPLYPTELEFPTWQEPSRSGVGNEAGGFGDRGLYRPSGEEDDSQISARGKEEA